MQKLQEEVHTQTPKTCSASNSKSMNIIAVAFDMAKAVEIFIQKAKIFFYRVMLLGHRCPTCQGSLIMVTEGKCRCTVCGLEFDPTVEFERCLNCSGVPVLRIRRYQCSKCHTDIKSKFLFDGLIFNVDYFRHKVAESRERKKEQRERVRQMLAECRSSDLPIEAVKLESVPGLVEALNSLVSEIDENVKIELRDEFDLKRYEKHVLRHLQRNPVELEQIPALIENARKDLIWRFIAIIFLAHAGILDVVQHGQEILVMKHETNRKGQDVLGEPEEPDGIEGSMGGIETW
jgi:hypothetical protein